MNPFKSHAACNYHQGAVIQNLITCDYHQVMGEGCGNPTVYSLQEGDESFQPISKNWSIISSL